MMSQNKPKELQRSPEGRRHKSCTQLHAIARNYTQINIAVSEFQILVERDKPSNCMAHAIARNCTQLHAKENAEWSQMSRVSLKLSILSKVGLKRSI